MGRGHWNEGQAAAPGLEGAHGLEAEVLVLGLGLGGGAGRAVAWGLEKERETDSRVRAGRVLQPLSPLSQEAQTQPLTPLFLFLCSRVSLPLP